ncbi:hypothetical protein RCO28_20645 [Streptomyces sp. LHD-70]|uniref:hypothetical protein n=1 Tax=Streptomyces sp. LHD-70 TaxID=3072140 RepID=UPI00280E0620|nr:hypothetical protein [Streptomyces sp. LHD-70]MDQ8704882.1 hypothetical protein [Streptomyces sp. LHD-70]
MSAPLHASHAATDQPCSCQHGPHTAPVQVAMMQQAVSQQRMGYGEIAGTRS